MISSVFAAVKAQLENALKALGQELPVHELGADHLATMSAPPRIVWVLDGGRVTPARQTGSGSRALGIREIAERNERCLIHVWGDDFDATDRLMNHFVAAAREIASGFSFHALSTDWKVGQDQKTAAGRLCVLEIEIRIPFTAEPLAISQPPHTPTITPVMNPPA